MRDELRSLDLAEPPEQWADIQRRIPRPHGPATPTPTSTRRILTGAVALLVGIAGVGFGIHAFSSGTRGHRTQNPRLSQIVPMGTDGSVLWPARTAVQLEQEQVDADTQRIGNSWLLYPIQVVQKFSSSVVGWPPPAQPMIIHGPDVNGRPTATARLTEPSATCPTPTSGAQSSVPCVANVEVIHLTQPVRVGEGGIWAITSVTSSAASIDAPPGGVITNGDSVVVHSLATEAPGTQAGFAVGNYDRRRNCSVASGGSADHPTTTLHVRAAPDSVAGSNCGVSAPGYIWVASPVNGSGGPPSSVQPPVADPFSGGAAPYSFVVAVPVLVRIPENALPVGMASYTFPSGWTADRASSWTAVTTYAPGPVAGISNAATPFTLKSMDVGLTVRSNAVSNAAPLRNDSQFPLSASDFQVEPGLGYRSDLTFRGNGVTYHAQLYAGPDALPADVAAMNQVIASIRFPSLGQPGRQVNG